jgi:Cu-Zn family superoxide dismutase
MRALIIGSALVIGGGAIAQTPATTSGTKQAPLSTSPSAMAVIKDAKGVEKGRATVTVAGEVMRLLVDVRDMPPGQHGLHLHMTGRCDAPAFTTAGDHWNPTGRKHGERNPQGPHAGDFKNISVGVDGKGSLSADVPGSYASLIDQDGASIIVHAAADDYKTDPSGNSGGRIACGVFG